jgi:hypothetical protein
MDIVEKDNIKNFLIDSQSFIKNEKDWIKKKMQANSQNELVDRSSVHAVKFCGLGSLVHTRVSGKYPIEIYAKAFQLLNKKAIEYVKNEFTDEFLKRNFPGIERMQINLMSINDCEYITHDDMMKIFDLTINSIE